MSLGERRCWLRASSDGGQCIRTPADPITIVVRVTRDDAKFARADIDFLAPNGQVVAQMQDYECVMEPTLNASFRKNQLALK